MDSLPFYLENKEGSPGFPMPLKLALVTQTLDQGNVIGVQASGLCWPLGAPGGTSQQLRVPLVEPPPSHPLFGARL